MDKIEVTPVRTYASEENADRAVQKKLGHLQVPVRYFIAWTSDGRCFPVFVGANTLDYGIHFHFNCVG